MKIKRIENPSKQLPEVIQDVDSEGGEKKASWVKRTIDKTKDAVSMEGIMMDGVEKMFNKYLPTIRKKAKESIPRMVEYLNGIDEEPKYNITKVIELLQANPELKEAISNCKGETKQERLEDLYYSVIIQNVDTVTAYQAIHHKRVIIFELTDSGDDVVMQILKKKYMKLETSTAQLSEGNTENLAVEKAELAKFWIDKFLEAPDLGSLMESVSLSMDK